jgi:hypothetical protein
VAVCAVVEDLDSTVFTGDELKGADDIEEAVDGGRELLVHGISRGQALPTRGLNRKNVTLSRILVHRSKGTA